MGSEFAVFETEIATPPKKNGAPKATVDTPQGFDLHTLRTRSYACYTVFTRPGQRTVETLMPPGTNFDLAWSSFCKFFKNRVGVDWGDVHSGWCQGLKLEEVIKQRPGGQDGAQDSRQYDVEEPLMARMSVQGADDEAVESIESAGRRPSVTVVLNTDEPMDADHVEAKAKTPDGGW